MRIIVIDDEKSQRLLLAGFLEKQKFAVTQADSGRKALEMLSRQGAEIAITDMRMPEMDGLTLLNEIRKVHPDTEVVVITAYASVENAVQAMKAGATDYLIKPVNLEQLMLILKKIESNQRLISENRYLRRKLESIEAFPDLIGKSQTFKKVLADISLVAKSDSTVLIRGESGTGKELVAHAIHSGSKRKDGPFLAVNCAALPETLLESELFGYEKGAFTGAQKRRIGRFELANKGTLFLDEIGDLSPAMQVKLLRVLETHSFERLGGAEPVDVDIRLITATNRNLEERMKNGIFREDLFYRLNVVPIHLPSLRERKDDILQLVEHFIKKSSTKSGKNILGITTAAKDLLLNYSWPGNIRELENAIERAVVLCRHETLDKSDLVGISEISQNKQLGYANLNLEYLEKTAIVQALNQSNGKLIEAAQLLGIHRNTLRLKIKHFDINSIENE